MILEYLSLKRSVPSSDMSSRKRSSDHSEDAVVDSKKTKAQAEDDERTKARKEKMAAFLMKKKIEQSKKANSNGNGKAEEQSSASKSNPASLFPKKAPKIVAKVSGSKRPAAKAAAAFATEDDDDAPSAKKGSDMLSLFPKAASKKGDTASSKGEEEQEVDPLDAFMEQVDTEVKRVHKADNAKANQRQKLGILGQSKRGERMSQMNDGFDYPSSDEEGQDDNQKAAAEEHLRHWSGASVRQQKELGIPDHTKIDYDEFRKDFYHPVSEIANMTDEEVVQFRSELENVKTRGKEVPRPIKTWGQAGFPSRILAVLKKQNYETPTPIQSQALPVILSGRDMLGIAKTGSGKTLAFMLPLIRHVMDQRRCEQGEGCIAMIMSPTRELALQIYSETRKFCKHLDIRVTCLYGGSDISDQIAQLKTSCEIIVCTPGRMIDMLTVNSGRITNMRRCTYVVLDEADRMFDMGFEPQVMRILANIRPDRQTVMFSATFPRAMEALARKILRKPIEVTVGGRSIVSDTVTQEVVVLKEEEKFNKLLELLGKYYPLGSTIVFVHRQEKADTILGDLYKNSYPCLSLHGAVSQEDRASNLRDFRAGNVKVMVATSIAARGIDVKQTVLVVNYDCPNHYEDYVHRCGRTGRAGRSGTAFSFITSDDKKYCGNIIKALQVSKTPVPADLQALWTKYKAEQKAAGKKVGTTSGFRGRGYKFSAEDLVRQKQKKLLQLKMHGALVDGDEYRQREEELASVIEDQVDLLMGRTPKSVRENQSELEDDDDKEPAVEASIVDDEADDETLKQKTRAKSDTKKSKKPRTKLEEAKARAEALNKRHGFQAAGPRPEPGLPEGGPMIEEIEVNEWPQEARYKVTRREFIEEVGRTCNAAITVKGFFYPPGKKVKEGERKIFLSVESTNKEYLDNATREIRKVLREEIHTQTTSFPQTQPRALGTGRYQVLAITGNK